MVLYDAALAKFSCRTLPHSSATLSSPNKLLDVLPNNDASALSRLYQLWLSVNGMSEYKAGERHGISEFAYHAQACTIRFVKFY
jgi:hypothetical protein